jgi:hypothetical protein
MQKFGFEKFFQKIKSSIMCQVLKCANIMYILANFYIFYIKNIKYYIPEAKLDISPSFVDFCKVCVKLYLVFTLLTM